MLPKEPTSKSIRKQPFRSKEVSWLSFNHRVLQEAGDPSVPLLERLKFLGIYSSNLDEFYRVRVATLKRLTKLGDHYKKLGIPDPNKTLKEVAAIVSRETSSFNETYAKAMGDLRTAGIRVVDEQQVPEILHPWLHGFFEGTVRPQLMPIMVKSTFHLSRLQDQPMYLAVRITREQRKGRQHHALIEIPSNELGRFVVLPDHGGETLVMYIDDIVRFGLPSLFAPLDYDRFDSYAVKFTRDAELEFDDDITESFFEKLTDGIRAREEGNPVRLNYDARIPKDFLSFLTKKLNLVGEDALFPGARYHNRKALMGFPKLGADTLRSPKLHPVPHPVLNNGKSSDGLFKKIKKKDQLLHFPYQSFTVFLDLLREACMDPYVKSIQITQYRLAKQSAVAKALITAVRSGKQVGVLVEPTARFDEEANIAWANEYQRAGVRVILGVPGLKVHTKLCLITRMEGSRLRHYTAVGTGNFNEDTAELYTDHMLLTADQTIGQDAKKIFAYFSRSFKPPKLKKLVVAPFHLRNRVLSLIQREIDFAGKGGKGSISIKINNFSDPEVTFLLYKASQAGVKIRLIVRSMFSAITQREGISENIQAIGIVDELLEHSRILRFGNGGAPEYYLSSADFLPRNFEGRVETLCPIEDPDLRAELDTYLRLQWGDSVKARLLDENLVNERFVPSKKRAIGRSQHAIREWLRKLSEGEEPPMISN